MRGKDKKNNLEDQKQIDVLEDFSPKIRKILREYRAKRQLSAIAKQLGFHSSRLTEMITKNSDGVYKRRITPYYLAKFIDGGVISVSQILQGHKLEDLPDRSRFFFRRMILPRKTVDLVIEAQRRGIDVDRILQEVLYPQDGH